MHSKSLIVILFASVYADGMMHVEAFADASPPPLVINSSQSVSATKFDAFAAFHSAIEKSIRNKALSELDQALKNPKAAFEAYVRNQQELAKTSDVKTPAMNILEVSLQDNRSISRRLKIFTQNIKRAAKQNAENDGSTTFGITQFSHLTPEEFEDMYLMDTSVLNAGNNSNRALSENSFEDEPTSSNLRGLASCGKTTFPYVSGLVTPGSFDWRNYGGVNYVPSPPRFQGRCGSCSAFAVTAASESAVIRNYASLGYKYSNTDISEQDLLQCTAGDQCQGEWPSTYFNRFTCTGFAFESYEPYTGVDTNACNSLPRYTNGFNHWGVPPPHKEGVSQAVLKGVTVVVINGAPLQTYVGGVFNCGSAGLTHSVAVVGWSNNVSMANGQTWQVFNVRNSWGSSWGPYGGYFYLRKDCTGSGSLGMYNNYGGVFLN